jgi:hypothetical protein
MVKSTIFLRLTRDLKRRIAHTKPFFAGKLFKPMICYRLYCVILNVGLQKQAFKRLKEVCNCVLPKQEATT